MKHLAHSAREAYNLRWTYCGRYWKMDDPRFVYTVDECECKVCKKLYFERKFTGEGHGQRQ